MERVFFQPAATRPAASRVALEPVRNALNSLALLNMAGRLPALDGWVRQTADALTTAERDTNRLVFKQLGSVLVANADQNDFERYLESLTQQHPVALRDQALSEFASADSAARPDAEAQALFDDPFRLHDLIVSHLRSMWDRWLAAEWARTQRDQAQQVRVLQQSIPNSGMAPAQILRNLERFIAQPAGASDARELVFVPSPHTGRHTTELCLGQTRWLFFDAQLNRSVLWRDSPVREPELMGRLSALTEPMRLRVLELLAQRDELTIQEIMEQLDVSQPNTSRYLKSLSVYVNERRGKDGKKYYRLVPTQLELTFHTVRQMLLTARPSTAAPEPPAVELPAAVARWLSPEGILSAWPARESDRLAVLEYLAGFFEVGAHYTEQQINEIIVEHVFSYARDHVTIRRDMVDYHMLHRAPDGSRYWRNPDYQAAGAAQS